MTLHRMEEEESDDTLSPEVVAFVRRALSLPLPESKEFLSITLPAPTDSAEKFLRLVPREKGYLWRSTLSGEQFAGGGACGEVTVTGRDRFARLAKEVPAFFARIATVAFSKSPPQPVLVGGAAFAPNVPAIAPWEEFTVDSFTLPRWLYRRRKGSSSTLTLTLRGDEVGNADRAEQVFDELRTLLRAFEYESPTSLIERIDPTDMTVHQLPLSDWKVYIDRIHAAIKSGEYKKIVAARRCVVDLPHRLEETGFMARIFAAYPDCIHFAIRRQHSTFFGATPETLFRKRGLSLETHALAGTVRIKDDPATESSRDVTALQNSEKDLVEHAYVVDRICEDLKALTTKLTFSKTPDARQVRNLIHLQTPISATLRTTTSVFDLLSTLHPTPAVGGLPTREAAEWISANEPLERGWYTGTIGWIDAAGDGEFAVAIRCGVLAPNRAFIFAGAGIVAASDAAAEYAETEAKMWPMLRTLGVAQTPHV